MDVGVIELHTDNEISGNKLKSFQGKCRLIGSYKTMTALCLGNDNQSLRERLL
jgi:hypothetical protein